MKILLDHCVDWRLGRALPGHTVKTAQEMGWEQLKNGVLLSRAAGEFDVFLTTDRNIRHQQNLETLPIAIIELRGRDNRLKTILALATFFDMALQDVKSCRFVAIHPNGTIERVISPIK